MLLHQLVSLLPGQTDIRTLLCDFIFSTVNLGSMLMGDVLGFSIGPILLLGVVLILSTDKLYTFL